MAVVRAATRMLQGASINDLAWLSRGADLCNNVYSVHGSPSVAAHPAVGDLPWPVLLLLGSHSRKHLFLRRRALNMRSLHKSINDFTNRILWS